MLVASLHQGISDLIPTRLDFYENWLNPAGMRNGKIGLAPLAAVLSFLRQEGEPYALVTERAGQYAAQRVVHRSYGGSRARVKLRRGEGVLTLRSSIFCTVRDTFDWPLCVYYSAALARLLTLVNVEGTVGIESCQGLGDRSCVITLKVPQNQK